MRYFKATEIERKPFITWDLWANDENEFANLDNKVKRICIPENLIPLLVYGVCPYKIINGALVERTKEEMQRFSDEFNIEESNRKIVNLKQKMIEINSHIILCERIEEDTTELENEFKLLLDAYNLLKQ